MASVVCTVSESRSVRVLRLGSNAVAIASASLLLIAAAFDTTVAIKAQLSKDAALGMAATGLLFFSICSSRNAARFRLPVLLAGIAAFVALAFSDVGRTGTGFTATTPAATHSVGGLMPMAGLIALSVVATQIGANLASRAACHCE